MATPNFGTPIINPFGLSDVGTSSAPTFADIDGDGDLDAFVGNLAGNTLFYLNMGSASAPAFDAPLTNPSGLGNVGFSSVPTFADIDGDGDLDAFIGNRDGNTLFYLNTGSASAPAFATAQTNPFGLGDVGILSAPTFADIDGDGDLDAFIGNSAGNTLFYLNTGSASAPAFNAPQTNPFGLEDVGVYSTPTFADIDGDGDLDAFVGNRDGNTLFFENAPTLSVTAGSNAAEPNIPGSFTLTLNQTAPAGGITVSYTLGGTATNGTDYTTLPGSFTFAAGSTTATISVAPIADNLAEGSETVILTLVDQLGYTLGANTTATITLADPPNQPPTAFKDFVTTNEDTAVTINAMGNDTDSNGDPLSLISFTNPTNGTVTRNDNGTPTDLTDDQLVYTPNANYNGSDSFTYTISDGRGGTATATVTLVNIAAVNDAPTAIALSNNTVTENDAAAVIGNLAVSDPDVGDTYTFDLSDDRFEVVDGELKLKDGISLDYETEQSISLEVTATDQGGLTTTQGFTLNVTDVDENTAPTDLSLSNAAIDENVPANTLIGSFSTVDAEGGSFTYEFVSGAGDTDNGAFTISGDQLKITSSPDFEAQDSYTIRVQTTDSEGASYEESLTIDVTNVNEAPDAVNDTGFTANQSTAKVFAWSDLLANDTDPDAGTTLSITGVRNAVGGSVVLDSSNQTIVFTPNSTFSGTARFDYTLSDGTLTDTARVNFSVGRTVNGGNNGDTLTGNAGEDILNGNNGSDTLSGGAGNDILNGGFGGDTISGSTGDDIINGGHGPDRLTGGGGRDTFVLDKNAGGDTITDFSNGTDVIGLSGLTFGQLTIAASGNNTLIQLGGTTLATLSKVNSSLITAEDFVAV